MKRVRLFLRLAAVVALAGAALAGCPAPSEQAPPSATPSSSETAPTAPSSTVAVPETAPAGHVAGAAASTSAQPDQPGQPGQPDFANALPEGPEKLLVVGRCTICHDERYLAQQRLTKAQWEKTVAKMKGFGSPISDEEIAQISAYLTRSFPADQPRPPAVFAAKPVVPYR